MGFTGNQWAIVALVFVLGWLLGLLSRSGGARWKREAAAERDARVAAERQVTAQQERIAELERGAATVGAPGAIGAAASGRRDDLSLIRGVGRERETRLNDSGVHSYRQLEGLSDGDVATLETRHGWSSGTIAREHWREQAATLRNEGVEAHRTRYL